MKEEKKNQVSVVVITTSGTWPMEGFETVPDHQKIKNQLEKATRELHLTDTTNWIAKINGQEIDVEKNYIELGLNGEISIDFGPREGGGGF